MKTKHVSQVGIGLKMYPAITATGLHDLETGSDYHVGIERSEYDIGDSCFNESMRAYSPTKSSYLRMRNLMSKSGWHKRDVIMGANYYNPEFYDHTVTLGQG